MKQIIAEIEAAALERRAAINWRAAGEARTAAAFARSARTRLQRASRVLALHAETMTTRRRAS